MSIQQRNEWMDQQCAAVCDWVKEKGFKCCILKGQGIALEYGEELGRLRQSGDVDILMWKEDKSPMECKGDVLDLALKIDRKAKGAAHHVSIMRNGVEVEMHYAPAYLCNPFANRRFQKWFCSYDASTFKAVRGFVTPDADYNAIFLLAHSFRHYLGEGLGLRQAMDYYFMLRGRKPDAHSNQAIMQLLSSLNMAHFTGAMMWVMQEVFFLDENFLLCRPDKHRGALLLQHIMSVGNFGHYEDKHRFLKYTHTGRFLAQLSKDLTLAVLYPREALWAPISMIREFVRIRI